MMDAKHIKKQDFMNIIFYSNYLSNTYYAPAVRHCISFLLMLQQITPKLVT